MKKYIKRIWLAIMVPLAAILMVWPDVLRGEFDHRRWDFWND